MHPVSGLIHESRCIGKHNLKSFAVENTNDAMTGGLWFRGDHGHFFTHQCIEQSGFTHIGFTENIDKTGMMRLLISQRVIIEMKKVVIPPISAVPVVCFRANWNRSTDEHIPEVHT